jgi:hypothetical protein
MRFPPDSFPCALASRFAGKPIPNAGLEINAQVVIFDCDNSKPWDVGRQFAGAGFSLELLQVVPRILASRAPSIACSRFPYVPQRRAQTAAVG